MLGRRSLALRPRRGDRAVPSNERGPAGVDRLTGDWFGSRSRLEERGVRFSLFYNQFGSVKNSGGVDRKSGAGASGSSDLIGQFDFGQMGAIPGGQALFHVKADWGRNINPRVGALGDPIDDADGDRLWIRSALVPAELGGSPIPGSSRLSRSAGDS